MLKAVATSMPGVAVFTNFCYSQHSQLFYDKIVSSESGIQQGDPLGPLRFLGADGLAHYRENLGIIAKPSSKFLVSGWRCPGGLRRQSH